MGTWLLLGAFAVAMLVAVSGRQISWSSRRRGRARSADVEEPPSRRTFLAAVTAAVFSAYVAATASTTVARDVLHFGCIFKPPSIEGPDGAWLCDGITYVFPAVFVGSVAAFSIFNGFRRWQRIKQPAVPAVAVALGIVIGLGTLVLASAGGLADVYGAPP